MKKITLKNYKKILGEDESRYDWEYISKFQKLSEEFIREFQDKVDWNCMSRCSLVSGDFIVEFQHQDFDWNEISAYYKLSLNNIRALQDKVNWFFISMHQNLTDEFVKEFRDKVELGLVYTHQNIKKNTTRINIHFCGNTHRTIFINLGNPKIIHIGCFEGTKKKAIKKIKKSEYNKKGKKKYIKKIKKCFKLVKKKLDR
jgi:hypothetical protein